MNPVFLKHREKVEYSEYDGSDLVYPGDKKGEKGAVKAGKNSNSGGNNSPGIKPSKIQSQTLGVSPSKSGSPLAKDKRSSSTFRGGRGKDFVENRTGAATDSTRGKTVSPFKKKKFSPPKGPLRTVDFELAGKVLGQDFRSQITDYANECGITGYVGRTNIGTIAGVLQGEASTVEKFKQWIKEGGSDKHKMDKCVFRNEKEIQKMNLEVFIKFVEIIKRDPNDNILTSKEDKPKTPPKNETTKSGKTPKK